MCHANACRLGVRSPPRSLAGISKPMGPTTTSTASANQHRKRSWLTRFRA
jgi:hypothetical protein